MTSLRSLDLSYNKLSDFSFIELFDGLSTFKFQANPIEHASNSLESLAKMKHLKDFYIEVAKLTSRHLKQAVRMKRINGVPAQEVFKELF